MAINDAYATADEYRAVAEQSSEDNEADIDEDLVAVSRYIERELGRCFNQDQTATTRYYYGNGSRLLAVEEIAATAGLTIKFDEDMDGEFADEVALASTDYELWPLNADKGPEPMPWSQIYLPAWSSRGIFPRGMKIEVTAKHGWPAVPKAVKRLTIELTRIWRLETPRATRRVTDLGEVFSSSAKAQDLIDRVQDMYWIPELA